MSTRYYLAPIIGDGSDENLFRAKVMDYPINGHSAQIPSDPKTGKPVSTWALVMVEADDHGPLLADPELDALPDLKGADTFDSKPGTKDDLVAKLAAKGVDTATIADTTIFAYVLFLIRNHLEGL